MTQHSPAAAAPHAAPRPRPRLWILVAVAAVGPLGMNIFLPTMPRLEEMFDTSYGTVQLTLSLYFIGFAVSQLVYGPLADRFGRRPVILTALTIGVAGSLATMIGGSIWVLVAGRFLQAVGNGGGFVLARAMVRDMHSRDRAGSAIATITMALVVAPMFAPLIGSYLDAWVGWRGPMALMAVFGLAAMLAALRFLHETLDEPQPLPSVAGVIGVFIALLRMRPFVGYTFHTAFAAAVYFSFLGGGPYVMQTLLGVSAEGYGYWFILVAVTYMLGNLASSRYSHRVGIDIMIRIGNTLVLVAALTLAFYALFFAMTPAVFMGVLAVIGLGNGFNVPNGFAGAISVDPSRAGTASGLTGFIQMSLGAFVSFLAGTMLTTSATPLVFAFVICAGAAIFSHWQARRPARTGP